MSLVQKSIVILCSHAFMQHHVSGKVPSRVPVRCEVGMTRNIYLCTHDPYVLVSINPLIVML